MSDLAKEIAQTVVRIKTEMRKARFASRSEAGRYAANQRWKGQGKQAKTPLDDLSIRGMTPAKMAADELRTYIDEQEGLLESMQGSASKAELKQQKGLITLARRDLRRMEGSETKVKPKTSKPGKTISSQEANAVERVEMFMRSTQNLDQSVLDRMADKYKTDPVSDADRKLLDETKKEMLAAGEAAKTAIQNAFAAGSRDATDKLGKTLTSSSRKTVKQMTAEGLTQKSPSDSKPEITIRGTILQTKVMVLDRLALQLKDIPEALTASYRVGKAKSFASRSEAGRYAANMRWKGQGQASAAGGGSSPTHKVDFQVVSSGRFTHVDGNAFDGQVSYKIGNENEFPDDMDFGFAFSMPGEGFIHAAILKSGFSQKVMSNRNNTPSLDQIKNRTVELNQELGRAVSDHLKTLNIRDIAKGIEQEYTRADKTIPRAVSNAITSMKSMRNINDVQGYATGQKVVSRAVTDLASFNSEIGKMVKAELRDRVKNASPKAPTAGLRRANSLPFDELRSN